MVGTDIPTLIPTSMTPAEAERLAELARSRGVVLEIGAWQGFSTVLLAQAADLVYSVDHHKGDMLTGHGSTREVYFRNLTRFKVDNVVALVGTSEQVLPRLKPRSFDLVFIDALHTYEAAHYDTNAALGLVRHGGVIAWHDYGVKNNNLRPEIEFGVTRAVDETRLPIQVEGTLAWATVK